jgi:hypothetical protein
MRANYNNYSSLPAAQQCIIDKAAKAAGLDWGGDFRRKKDWPHFYDDLPLKKGMNRKQAIKCAGQQYNNMKK